MKECYEYFNCDSMNCSKRKNNGEHCWDLESDLCHVHDSSVTFLREQIESKKEACKLCFYYKDQIET